MNSQPPKLSAKARAAVDEVASSEGFSRYDLEVSAGSSPGENFLGEIFRVLVTGTKDDEESRLRLIVKTSPSNEMMRGATRFDLIYAREIMMYKEVLPKMAEIQSDMPESEKLHFAKLFLGRDQILIMEDLTESGFTMCDKLKPLDWDHLSICIRNLASFHALSMALKAREPELYAKIASRSARFSDFGGSCDAVIDMYRSGYADLISGKPYESNVQSMLDDWNAQFSRFYDPPTEDEGNEEPRVLCHGDCWSNNMLFKYEDDRPACMRLVDWQMVRATSPCFDLGYLIFTSTDRATRLAHYDSLLGLYHDSLCSNLTSLGLDAQALYPDAAFRSQLADFMRAGVMMAMMMLPVTMTATHEQVADNASNFEKFDRQKVDARSGETEEGERAAPRLSFPPECVRRLEDMFEETTESGLI